MPSSLKAVLQYRNDDIVDRLAHEHQLSAEDAREIFTETLRWLWLCAEARRERKAGKDVPRLVIDEPLDFIDQGWHAFILFTKAYADFCAKHFGFFIHHNPTPVRRKKEIISEIDHDSSALDGLLNERRKQYEFIYDKLGSDTLIQWYEVLSDKYKGCFGSKGGAIPVPALHL
jgi:hypothetical protein